MKNLKFRIWDSENHTFIYNENLKEQNFEIVEKAIAENLLTTNTGLVDINGNEIYEGDYVSVYNTYKEKYYKGLVKYNSDNAEFVLQSPSLTSHKRWINYEMKIVGNKFENPGYLTKFS